MPSPVEALPCGSESISSTRSPTAASAVPRFMAVVVLPTPPFWLATTSTRSDRSDTGQPPHTYDPASGVAQRGHDFRLKLPISCSLFKLRRNILSLEEQARGAAPQVWPGIPEELEERRAGPRHHGLHLKRQIL